MSDVHAFRPRSSSAANTLGNTLQQPRVSSPNRHARTSSEFSGSRRLASPTMTNRSPLRIRQQPSQHSMSDLLNGSKPGTSSSQRSFGKDMPSRLTLGEDVKDGPNGTFLNLDESEGEGGHRNSGGRPILGRNDDTETDKPPGLAFDELVDRLLAQPMSKADVNFIETFLCLYRKFAAPGKLLGAILDRLDSAADDKTQHFLLRTNRQLRIVGILTKWVMSYPGDFASTSTRERLVGFVENISKEPAFSYPALEMKIALRTTIMYDDDTRWDNADPDYDTDADTASKEVTPASSLKSAPASKSASKASLIEEAESRRLSEAISELSSISVEPSLIESGRPSGLHSVQEYESQAAGIVPTRRSQMIKPRWQCIMDISDEDWANEITKMDWILFSSVRVRDLMRDVNISGAKKAKFKSLANVTRAINHFNQLAAWVSNIILFRDKAKHRAMMLEKWMRIAWKLRQLNNYNGLAAVMAGLQNTAVSRLAQTQALISPDDRKNFMRLEILMGPRRSHFAYRLAWQNSPLPRIPYIPLSRRDLASAEEGSKTMFEERINWKKMEVFGAVILPIVASSGSSYSLSTNPLVRQLILDTGVVTDDEVLYQRSLVLEASNNSNEKSLKQRFKLWTT